MAALLHNEVYYVKIKSKFVFFLLSTKAQNLLYMTRNSSKKIMDIVHSTHIFE